MKQVEEGREVERAEERWTRMSDEVERDEDNRELSRRRRKSREGEEAGKRRKAMKRENQLAS